MGGENGQSPRADGVAGAALNPRLILGEIGDGAPVLQVLGVAEEDGAGNLVFDGGTGLRQGITDDGRSLAVIGCNARVSPLSL